MPESAPLLGCANVAPPGACRLPPSEFVPISVRGLGNSLPGGALFKALDTSLRASLGSGATCGLPTDSSISVRVLLSFLAAGGSTIVLGGVALELLWVKIGWCWPEDDCENGSVDGSSSSARLLAVSLPSNVGGVNASFDGSPDGRSSSTSGCGKTDSSPGPRPDKNSRSAVSSRCN